MLWGQRDEHAARAFHDHERIFFLFSSIDGRNLIEIDTFAPLLCRMLGCQRLGKTINSIPETIGGNFGESLNIFGVVAHDGARLDWFPIIYRTRSVQSFEDAGTNSRLADVGVGSG